MSNELFTPQQLFSLKGATLEKRLTAYYKESHDEKLTIKILVALQVRGELGEADFAFFMRKFVRQLFMKTKATRALRRYYVFFKDYFEKKEWQKLTLRLFPLKTRIAEKLEQLYTQFVKEPLQGLVGS